MGHAWRMADMPKDGRRDTLPPSPPRVCKTCRQTVPDEKVACSAPDRAAEIAVLSIVPEGEGELVAVTLCMLDNRNVDDAPRMQRRRVRITVEQYVDLRITVGACDEETVMRILDAGRLCEAIRMGMSLLYYGDLSERRMVYKLTARGMERAVAQKAAHYLCERGLLQETESAVHRARQSVRKGWGRRRIADDLRAHGYADGAIEDALVALEDVDFEALCAEVIRKKYRSVPDSSPTGRAARQKMIAALLRLGFSMDEVRHAMHTVMAEKANT